MLCTYASCRQEALASYTPRIHQLVHENLVNWSKKDNILGFVESKSLAFHVSSRVLLGLDLNEGDALSALKSFETFINCIFSMPVDLPGSGLRKVKLIAVNYLQGRMNICLT